MANGTPIRLIQRNGGIIELNVTTVTMDVDRKFNPKPLVYSGSHRVATDSNLTRAVIQLEGFIADDDAVFVSSSTQASASIDFSYRIDGVRKIGDEITDDEKEDMVRNLATYWRPGTISNIRTPKLALDDTNVIYFVEDSASDGYTGSVHWVSLYDESTSTAKSAASIAQGIANRIAAMGAPYTTSTGTSPYTGQANAVVSITRTENGNDTKYPKFKKTNSGAFEPLIITKYVGYQEGAGTTGMSAGDKVQQLWGVLNNSQDGGKGRTRERDDVTGRRNTRGGGDYIIGIQIPFESMVNAVSGEKYSAVNHFMTTGTYHLQNPETKDVENATLAGVEFSDAKNSYTGIKGGVDKATFVRLGGEPLYQFTIIFLPADVIL